MKVLGRIRFATRELHRALERGSPLGGDDVTVADYRRYLEKLLGFHAPLEQRMRPLICRYDLAGEFAGRRKTPLFVRDLEALGLQPATPDAVPWSPWLPAPDGVGGLLGCAYVLEGATLGGKVILRQLAPRVPEVAAACRYLDCYGREVGARWQAMLALLEARVVTPEAEDAAVAAARDCFAALSRWLDHGAVPRA